MRKLSKSILVQTIYYDEIFITNGPSLRFRVDIIKRFDIDMFDAFVFRIDTYRMKPSFPSSQAPDDLADHEIYVLDDFLNGFPFRSNSPVETINIVEAKIAELFGPAGPGDT